MKNFIQKIQSLDNILQWEERDSIIRESVSQHSFKVASIAYYILNNLDFEEFRTISEKTKYLEFKYDVLSYAVMHDFDEAILGRDISHTVKYNKYNGGDIRKTLNEFVKHELDVKFDNVMPNVSPDAQAFVKLCDWIALLTFINRNKRMGCMNFDEEYEYCIQSMFDKVTEVNKILSEKYKVKNINSVIKSLNYERS